MPKLSDIRGSKSFMALNPHLVGGVHATQPKPNSAQALVGSDAQLQESSGSSKRWVVSIVAHRHRLLDSDNFEVAVKAIAKPIRDEIANLLHVDDGDSRITFEYHQVITKAEQGIAVTVHEYEHVQKSG